MAENSRGGLFRTRNVLGTALVAGIGLGIYLGKFNFLGFFGGKNDGSGAAKTESVASIVIEKDSSNEKDDSEPKMAVPNVVKVLIDDREFLVRDGNQDVPIKLETLIKLVKQAPGDADGFQIKIYEKLTARTSAEESLKKALVAAGIPNTAIFWVPVSVK